MGVCVANGTSNLGSCKCDPFFIGETCDNYSCHTFCFNKGICYLEPGPNAENDFIAKVLLLFLLLFYLSLYNCYYFISVNVHLNGLVTDVIFLYLQEVVQAVVGMGAIVLTIFATAYQVLQVHN
jgi:hypothetical protein